MNINLLSAYKLSIYVIALVLIVSCSPQPTDQADETSSVEINYTELVSGSQEKYIATIAIEGMGCEMSCGHKISTALAAIGGVTNARIDFKAAGEVNHAIVEYDASKVSEKEFIKTVNALDKGHYEVKAVDVIHHLPADEAEGQSEELSLSRSLFRYKLPDIFSVFARLL